MNQPASAYFLEERHDPTETHTLSVLVQNEPGVLARVIGLFSGRGYNIDSLTVAPVEDNRHRSRINIVTSGTEMVIQQIKAQLDRLVPVHRVADLSLEGPHIAREMAHQVDERIELVGSTGQLEYKALMRCIDHPGAECLGDAERLGAEFAGSDHLN